MNPTPAPNWNQLYNDFDQLSASDAAELEAERAAQQVRQEFERWSRGAMFQVMNAVAETSKRQADLLQQRGVAIQLGQLEAHGDPSLTRAPETLHLALCLGNASVYIYATRSPHRPTFIHLGYHSGSERNQASAARKRFVTLPGVALLRGGASQVLLRDARDPNQLGATSDSEQLVFRALSLLRKRSAPTAHLRAAS